MIKITGCPTLRYLNPDHVESVYIREERQKYIVFIRMVSAHQHAISHDKMDHAEACAAFIGGWGKSELTTIEKAEAENL